MAPLSALIVNCTLKPSPAESNTDALADVVAHALESEEGRPIAYNRVAGVVVTGNEDGAHHVIAEVAQALIDIGFTVPGQAWTYWNKGPGPGPSYLETGEGHEWSQSTGRAAAGNLVAVACALRASPIPPPPS